MLKLIKTASIALLTLLLILVPMLFKPDAAQAGFSMDCRDVNYSHGQSTFEGTTDVTLLSARCRDSGSHYYAGISALPLHKFIAYEDGRLVWNFNPDRTKERGGFFEFCNNSWIRVQQADWNGQTLITRLYANCNNAAHQRFEESDIILDEHIFVRFGSGRNGIVNSKLEWRP